MRPARRAQSTAIAAALALLLVLALAPVALAAPLQGRLDRSFGQSGRVLFGLGPTFANSAYTGIVRQPDGSTLLVGQTESVQGKYIEPAVLVQRRLPDGALDPGFHQVVDKDGSYTFTGLALQPDGDVLYGEAGQYSGDVVRLDPDGTPDQSYGKRGASAELPLTPRFLAVDGEGRTVVAGTAGVGGNCHDCLPSPRLAVARLLPNGALDKSFGKGGSLILEEPELGYGEATGLVLGADGTLVVAGEGGLFGLTAAGALNPAFGLAGVVATKGTLGALTQTSGGDLVAAGSTFSGCCSPGLGSFVVRAFHPDGTPDPAWGSGGATTIAVADIDLPTALAPTPAGGVILAGETAVADEPEGCRHCNFAPYVARLTASGAVDPGFTSSLAEAPDPSRQVGPTQGYPSRVGAIAVAPSGQVLLAGISEGVAQASLTALTPSGAADPSFGAAGVAADRQGLPSATGTDGVAAGRDGSLAVSYETNAGVYSGLWRLSGWSADGAPLSGFGGEIEPPSSAAGSQLDSDASGRLYRYESSFEGPGHVVRFAAGGGLDPSYGAAGKAELPLGLEVNQLVVRPSGVALLIGDVASKKKQPMALFELDPEGHPVETFGHHGLVELGWGKGGRAEAEALAATFDRRGRIVLFGLYGRQTPLARLLPDGRLDSSFGHGGRLNFKPEIETEHSSVVAAPNGRVYLATSGRFGQTTLARFRPDGARDRSFGKDGILYVENHLPLLRLFPGGRQLILVSGSGSFGNSGYELQAFHRDGRPDPSFGRHGAVAHQASPFGPIEALRQASGRIVLVGTRDPLGLHEEVELMRFR
jgi:uncharacterized delta-60 repeat protein